MRSRALRSALIGNFRDLSNDPPGRPPPTAEDEEVAVERMASALLATHAAGDTEVCVERLWHTIETCGLTHRTGAAQPAEADRRRLR
jgi:hypothetical protein